MANTNKFNIPGVDENFNIIDDKSSPRKNSMKSFFSPFWDSEDAKMGHNTSLQDFANSPGINAILGAGDALRNMMSLGLYKPESTNFGTRSGPESGEGIAYEAGKLGGDIAGFIGGGELLDLVRFAGEGIPLAGKGLAKLGEQGWAPSAARRISGSAIGGAAENPDDRLKGAMQGAKYGGIGELAGNVPGGIGHVAEMIVPQKYTEVLKSNIEKHAVQMQEKSNELYNKAKGIFKEEGKINFDNSHLAKLGSEIEEEMSKYPNIRDWYKKLKSEKKMGNYDDFQSQLGHEIRDLEFAKHIKGALEKDQDIKLQNLLKMRSALKKDVRSVLPERNKRLLDAADRHYANNISPLKMTKIFDHDFGERITPGLMEKELRKPIKKFIENEPGRFRKDRRANITDYLPDNLKKDINLLGHKINRANILKYGAGLLGGGALGMSGGIPGIGTAAAAGLGAAYKAPEFVYAMEKFAKDPMFEHLAKYLSKAKEPTKKAFTAYMAQGK